MLLNIYQCVCVSAEVKILKIIALDLWSSNLTREKKEDRRQKREECSMKVMQKCKKTQDKNA